MTHDSDSSSAPDPSPPDSSPPPQTAPERSEGAGPAAAPTRRPAASPASAQHPAPGTPASPPASPPGSVHRVVARLALVVTFTLGAALGLILGPLGIDDRLPEPLRSALLPQPIDLADQLAALQAQLDAELVALRNTGVSRVAFDELIADHHARPEWRRLTDQITATRTARVWRLLAAAGWCAAVLIACTIVIRRRRAADRPVDETWHWTRHAAAFALGFCAAILIGYSA